MKLHFLGSSFDFIGAIICIAVLSDRQLFAYRGCRVVNATDPHGRTRFSRPEPLLYLPSSSSVILTRQSGPRSSSVNIFILIPPDEELFSPKELTKCLRKRSLYGSVILGIC
jgi:hypothetical protein